jgi:hypothetical protein
MNCRNAYKTIQMNIKLTIENVCFRSSMSSSREPLFETFNPNLSTTENWLEIEEDLPRNSLKNLTSFMCAPQITPVH